MTDYFTDLVQTIIKATGVKQDLLKYT